MGVGYRAVGWNRQKRVYDRWLLIGVAAALASFIGTSAAVRPELTPETLIIRAFGLTALVLLHVVLLIGPLARLFPRWLPLLYNRRHMGVTMFVLALVHGVFSLLQFHGFGDLNPLVSLFVSGGSYDGLANVPFQPLGFAALVILFLMAATSHDFWLHNLTAPVWKALHMGVYAAYVLVVLHVALGALWGSGNSGLALALALGAGAVGGAHLLASRREAAGDVELAVGAEPVDVCAVSELEDGRGMTRTIGGERVAIFRDGERVFALSNVCQHQNGPLGEGRVRKGCVVCPWHGYEYRPEDGCSPPPFEERIPTFRVRIAGGRVQVDPRPVPAGTHTPPATLTQLPEPDRGDCA
ncbi:MAG: Rieske 2Fe-2S domain-containing protein [Planctomycetota bacterium]